MFTKVQKWGNSLALEIPKSFAADARIKDDSIVEVSFVDGHILIKPVITPSWTLEQLLYNNINNSVYTSYMTV